jgi:hypothetical protein
MILRYATHALIFGATRPFILWRREYGIRYYEEAGVLVQDLSDQSLGKLVSDDLMAIVTLVDCHHFSCALGLASLTLHPISPNPTPRSSSGSPAPRARARR